MKKKNPDAHRLDLPSNTVDIKTDLKTTYFEKQSIYALWIFRIVGFVLGIYAIGTIVRILLGFFISTLAIKVDFTDALLIIFSIYFASWFYGSFSDITAFKETFFSGPNYGEIPQMGLFLCIFMSMIFCAIVILKNEILLVYLLLLVFLTINFIGWIYLKNHYKEIINQGLRYFHQRKEYVKLEKLVAAEDYLYGKWQNHRFIFAFFLLISMIIIIFSSTTSVISSILGFKSPDAIPVILVYVYVLTFESWVWLYRLKRNALLDSFSRFENEYIVTKKENL